MGSGEYYPPSRLRRYGGQVRVVRAGEQGYFRLRGSAASADKLRCGGQAAATAQKSRYGGQVAASADKLRGRGRTPLDSDGGHD